MLPAQQCIERMTRPLSQMIDLLDRAFARYDPLAFDVGRHDRLMFRALLLPDPRSLRHHPTHLFHVNWADDKLSAYVYHYDDGEVFRSLDTIEIPTTESRYAIFMAREIAQHHHEKFNGRGYPQGLQGEAIPLSARIVALVDVYDALRQPRVYKTAYSHARALEVSTRGDVRTRPDDFDPVILQAFLRVEATMDAIYRANPG
jgi:hypothetical protein